jgi:hypothetical protein
MSSNSQVPAEVTLKKALTLFVLVLACKAAVLLSLLLLTGSSLTELTAFGDARSYISIARSFPLPYSLPGMRADAIHYLLFPFSVWIFSPLFGGNYILAGFCSAIVTSSFCSVILYLIAQRHTRAAFELALIFAVLPDKWAQVSVYPFSEPIFMLCLLSAVLLHQRGKLLWAYSLLGLLVVARPVGVIFVFSFFVYDFVVEKRYFVIRYALISIVPLILFHGYLYWLFSQIMLFADAGSGGAWEGKVFSYPLSGLIEGIRDPSLMVVRKIYSTTVFSCYFAVFCCAAYHLVKTERFRLFSLLVMPYFIFTLFLRGSHVNWWMLSGPRFLIPLAPFGYIFILGNLPKKYLHIIFGGGMALAIAYTIGTHYLHLEHGPTF